MKIRSKINSEYQMSDTLVSFVADIHERFEVEGQILFQQRNCVKKYTLNIEGKKTDIIVKQFKKTNALQKISYSFLKKTKCRRSFENALELQYRGIDTPAPIAYVELWEKNLFDRGYYISRANYSSPIVEKLFNSESFDPTIGIAFAQFVATLHIRGILHHDLNSTNVLFCKKDASIDFTLIDINRMKFYDLGKQIDIEICYDNLTRFCGDINIYSFVLNEYIKYRELFNPQEELDKAISIKMKHDAAWIRKKKITGFLKNLIK